MIQLKANRDSKGFTLVELLVVIAIIGILIGMLLPAVQTVREAARRITCSNQMRQLSLGMMNYESAKMVFPSGIKSSSVEGRDKIQDSGLAWGALILPFVEQDSLYQQIGDLTLDFTDFGTAGSPTVFGSLGVGREDTSTGQYIASTVLPIFICPSCPMGEFQDQRTMIEHAKSNYVGVYGNVYNPGDVLSLNNGVLFYNSEIGFGQISDGSSNTFIIGERDGAPMGIGTDGIDRTRAASVWCISRRARWNDTVLGPTDGAAEWTINSAVNNDNQHKWVPFTSQHPGGSVFGRADGSTAFVSETISGDVYEAMGSRNGNETLSVDSNN